MPDTMTTWQSMAPAIPEIFLVGAICLIQNNVEARWFLAAVIGAVPIVAIILWPARWLKDLRSTQVGACPGPAAMTEGRQPTTPVEA